METCAYCGEEVFDESFRQSGVTYCCQECLDAANEDSMEYMDASTYYDDV